MTGTPEKKFGLDLFATKMIYGLGMAIFLVVSLLSTSGLALADQDFVVEYAYQNKSFSIQSIKVSQDTFVFNPGQAQKLDIVTLDWPPYIGRTVYKQGWVQQLTIAVLTSQGFEVTSHFYPWRRSIQLAETGKADILYPEYHIDANTLSEVYCNTRRLDNLALSRKLPGGIVAFMKRKGYRDNYKGDFNNLKGEKIGIVRGYINMPEFDQLMQNNYFDISTATNDLQNAIKLINNRVNLIIGDPEVIRFVLMHSNYSSKQKTSFMNKIELVKPVLEYKNLYLCFSQKRSHWSQHLKQFNQGLDIFKKSGEMQKIIKRSNVYDNQEIQIPAEQSPAR